MADTNVETPSKPQTCATAAVRSGCLQHALVLDDLGSLEGQRDNCLAALLLVQHLPSLRSQIKINDIEDSMGLQNNCDSPDRLVN